MSSGPYRFNFSRVVRDFLVVGVGNYGAIGLAFVINVVLARRLGAAAFGHVALLLVGSQVLSFVVTHWTQAGFIRFASEEFASSGTVTAALWTRTRIVAPWALCAAAALAVWRAPAASYLNVPPWALLVVFSHFVCSYGLGLLGAIFQSRQEMPRYATMLWLEKAAVLAAVVFLPSSWVRDPVTVLAVYVASAAAVSCIGFSFLGWRPLLQVVADDRLDRRMLRFSLPLIVSSWAGFFGTYWMDYVIIRRYLPLADLGLYALAGQLTGMLQQVTIVFSTLLLPRLSVMVARREEDRIQRLARQFLPYWFLGTSVLFSVALLLLSPLVPLLFGPAFRGTVAPLAMLMLSTSALTLFNAWTPLLTAHGMTWRLAAICVLSASANVALDVLLIPRFGIAGAAAATVIAYWVSALLTLAAVHRRFGIPAFRFAWLTLPVAVTYLCFMAVPGQAFYAAGAVGAVATAAGLAWAFRLFRVGEATHGEPPLAAAGWPAGSLEPAAGSRVEVR